MFFQNPFGFFHNLQMSPIPKTSFLVGTFLPLLTKDSSSSVSQVMEFFQWKVKISLNENLNLLRSLKMFGAKCQNQEEGLYGCHPYPRQGHLSVNQLKNDSYCQPLQYLKRITRCCGRYCTIATFLQLNFYVYVNVYYIVLMGRTNQDCQKN